MAHLILTALWLLFLVCWFVIYFCTAQQQSGGVAWIARYDRQASSFLVAREKLRGQDAAWLAGCAILPGLCAFLWSGQPSVLLCLMPALAGAGLYLLGRMLGGVPLLTALSAAGVAVSPDLHPAAGPFVVAVILFYRWMSLPGDTGFGRELACLGGSGIALLLAALWAPAVWWGLPVALALGAVCLAQRWREGLAYTGGRLARSLVLGLLLLAALLGVYLVCFGVQQGASSWREALAALPQDAAALLSRLGQALLEPVRYGPGIAALAALADDSALVLAGGIAWLALFVQMLWQRNAAAGFLFAVTLPLFLLLGSCYLLPVGLLANVAYVASAMWKRGKRAWAVLLPALFIGLELINQLLG